MQPFNSGYLQVGKIHKIYYHEYGNPKGVPILSLHGGPGQYSKLTHIQHFNQDKHRLILFDQRGCGNSTPLGEIKENTTQDLIEDIQKLKKHLNIPEFILRGKSWGSTLALLYAEQYPEDITGLILSSIFLARKQDIAWVLEETVNRFVPERQEALEWYDKQYNIDLQRVRTILLQPQIDPEDKDVRIATAYIANLQANLGGFDEFTKKYTPDNDVKPKNVITARISTHYEVNNFFIEENQILNNISKIQHIPTFIAHSRYDMVCPYEQAYILHKNLPKSQLFTYSYYSHYGGRAMLDAERNWVDSICN